MYFKNVNNIQYDYTVKTDLNPIIEIIPDFLQRVSLKISDTDRNQMTQDYVVMDSDTPEKIAFNFYNDPYLHWTILYINGICDLYAEWPLLDTALLSFCQKKYGVNNVYNIHHYEKLPEMLRMDPSFMQDQINAGNFDQGCIAAVTNYDFEYRINEMKRFIKIIKPDYISGFVKSFSTAQVQ
jgi:hypothetical protein